MTKLKGRCLCGAVTVRVMDAHDPRPGACHCRMCQRWSGGSHLWMRDTAPADAPYDLMPGLFDAALDWPLQSEIYVDRAMASVPLSGEHRRATRAEWEAGHSFVEGDA
ncbi:MAG: GFA family protein [Rhodobacteraceae bacterium]|nr:GFA family protein [Paracoccaceae bacterium]